MDTKTDDEYTRHIEVVQKRWETALGFSGFDTAIVAAGRSPFYFLDDQGPPFQANPHFLQWYPDNGCEASALLIRPGSKPQLFFFQPVDYWHQPPSVPDWADDVFDIEVFASEADLEAAALSAALASGNRVAVVGENTLENVPSADVNPTLLLSHLHYHRAQKTRFELSAMRAANVRAAAGHLVAAQLFSEGASEFDINHAYLRATGHTADELPYHSIVALNEHGGILHYQHYDHNAPEEIRSFLIDAGARESGYAADVTRTYAADPSSHFADLVSMMDSAQQDLIATVIPGVNYLDLHVDMHRRLAVILAESGIVSCSPDSAFASRITECFLPHGLGHLLGLQTHDVGGQQTGPEGGISPPPDNYPALRLTRTLEENTTVTIEPGLYFIPQLLRELKSSPPASDVNWPVVESLMGFGGIRIEDNINVTADGVENFTRDAFDQLLGR